MFFIYKLRLRGKAIKVNKLPLGGTPDAGHNFSSADIIGKADSPDILIKYERRVKFTAMKNLKANHIRDNWQTILFITLLFIGSFQIRIWYINGTSMISPIRADAALYTTIAANLANNKAYITEKDADLRSDLISRDPGYPVFLAGIIKILNITETSKFFYSTVTTQSILDAITVIISYFIARFFLPPLWSCAVSILTMLSPHLISMTNYVLTETLFTFLLQLSLILYLYAIKKRTSWLLAASGVSFGLSMCVKSVLQLFPIALVALTLYFFWNERRNAIKYAIILISTSFVFFIPWKMWSHYSFKDIEHQSLFKVVVYGGSYIGLVYNEENKMKYGIGMPYRDDPDHDNIVNDGYGRIFKEIGKKIKKDPLAYTSWYLFGKPAMFWSWSMEHAGGEFNVYPNNYTWYEKNRVMNLSKELMWFLHPLVIILMHIGVLLFIVRRKKYSNTQHMMMGTILMLILYFLSIHTILVPATRYSLPLRPLVYFMAVFAIAEIAGKTTRKREPINSKDA